MFDTYVHRTKNVPYEKSVSIHQDTTIEQLEKLNNLKNEVESKFVE